WWQPTADLLRDAGVHSAAAKLPSCGEGTASAGATGPGLPEDVAALRALLASHDEPTVVVAHSYGRLVTPPAAVRLEAVRRVLLISSSLADVGESLSSFGDGEPAPFLDVDPGAGTFGVRPELFADTFMHDCSELAGEAAARLTRQSVQLTQQPVEAAVWGQ